MNRENPHLKDEYSCPRFLSVDLYINSKGCNYYYYDYSYYYLVSASLRELELIQLKIEKVFNILSYKGRKNQAVSLPKDNENMNVS